MGLFDNPVAEAVKDAAQGGVDAVGTTAEGAGDVVEAVVDVAADVADDAVDAAANLVEQGVDQGVTTAHDKGGAAAGGPANVIGGLINGAVDAGAELLHDLIGLARDVGGIVGSFLRIDVGGLVQGIVDLVIDILDFVLDSARFWTGGFLVGAIVRQFEREDLRQFVRALLAQNFGSDAALLERIENRLKIHSAGWGLPLAAQHYVLMLDSANTPLWQWQADGTLDLYSLAGVLSTDSLQIERPRTWVRSVDSNGQDSTFPVMRRTIQRYLETRGEKARLRVYAMNREALAERLDVASDKCRKLGVRLSWNYDTRFNWGMFPTLEIGAKNEYRFVMSDQGVFVINHNLRTSDVTEHVTLLGLGAFYLDADNAFGQCMGVSTRQGDAAKSQTCVTPGRDDSCCAWIKLAWAATESEPERHIGSSVVHRDSWPHYAFRYVLAHEIGHYLGLCHFGHNGFQNIMYSHGDDEAGCTLFDWRTAWFYLDSEPAYTPADGKNVWRFIVSQMPHSLDDSL